jgi:hypothetical protein
VRGDAGVCFHHGELHAPYLKAQSHRHGTKDKTASANCQASALPLSSTLPLPQCQSVHAGRCTVRAA